MNELEKRVVEALKKVKDPETGSDIVSEGLIYGFTIYEDNSIKVFVSFESSTPTCNFCKAVSWTIMDRITKDITEALKDFGFTKIMVVEELNPKIIYRET